MEDPGCFHQFLFFLICLSIAVESQSGTDIFQCPSGVRSLGVTVPKGDIILEYGKPLEILCLLDPTQSLYNASSLFFYHNDVPVPSQHVSIVNQTTLRLFLPNPPISKTIYYCKIHTGITPDKGACLNHVFVGSKPQEVQNFTCVSYNWESLNCSWIPTKNPIKTYYRLSYYFRGKQARKYHYCPGETEVSHNYCVWNASSDPPYRQPYETYHFRMSASNALGNLTKIYRVNHYAVVKPGKPENLSLVEASSSSLTVSWDRPLALRFFPPGLQNKVAYHAQWDPAGSWTDVSTSHLDLLKGEKFILNVTGLKYAFTIYDIRVSMKSAQAPDERRWWSENATLTLRTRATVPGMAPRTDIGSFESVRINPSSRDVFIYWQQIPRNQENGDNFTYKIIYIEEELASGERFERNITPSSVSKTYAKFEKMSYNKYIFTVVSSNNEGMSRNISMIAVPSKEESPAEPVAFTKIVYDHGVYELSWNAPPRTHNITSYTIFWCDNKTDRPYPCTGLLNWTRVSENLTEKNITLPADKVFQFAISANTETTSSGMVWADCTVLPDQARGKLKNTWISSIGATFIEVSWKLECLRIRDIRGFRISYCPIRDPQDTSCKEPLRNKTIVSEEHIISRGNISGLKPYTTYMVNLAVISDKWIGQMSDPLLNTTLEAAPDYPPVNLREVNVTNTSITVMWSQPPSLNGVLRFYKIFWNDYSERVEEKSKVVYKTLEGLESYEVYNIRVSACTVACSPLSDKLSVKTKIGSPSQMTVPKIGYINSTLLNVSWVPPEMPGGPVDFFTVKFQLFKDKKKLFDVQYYNKSGAGTFNIETLSACQENGISLYSISVRAVNIDYPNGKAITYEGPWSHPAEGVCPAFLSGGLLYIVLMSVLIVLAVLVFCISCGCITKCLWSRCKAMQNIGVKLPPQLELDIYKDKVIDLPMEAHVPQHKPTSNDDSSDLPPPDQQSLLQNKEPEELAESSTEECEEMNGDPDRESSGCGSGHESVSSSITAGTHITDSGTEADERPASPDVFSESTRRQRNVSGGGSGSGGGGGDGYSRLARAPSGYVTMPPVSRGYVKHNWTPNQQPKGYDLTNSIGSQNPSNALQQSGDPSWTT